MSWVVACEWRVDVRKRLTTHYPLLTIPLLLGCGSPDRLVPLAVGKKWDYRFSFGVQREVGRIEVVREVPVAGGTGWEIQGPTGVSRLGYVGDTLVADQLGGAFLTPSLPIGLPSGRSAQWRGWVNSPTGRLAAKATVFSDDSKIELSGRKRSLVRTVVSMKVNGHAVELATWYAPSDGIVQQEQHTDQRLDLKLERIAGGS